MLHVTAFSSSSVCAVHVGLVSGALQRFLENEKRLEDAAAKKKDGGGKHDDADSDVSEPDARGLCNTERRWLAGARALVRMLAWKYGAT